LITAASAAAAAAAAATLIKHDYYIADAGLDQTIQHTHQLQQIFLLFLSLSLSLSLSFSLKCIQWILF